MSFRCASCKSNADLSSLAELSCSCLVCISCARSSIKAQLAARRASVDSIPSPNPEPPPKAPRRARIDLGDTVLYRTADGTYVEATVEIVDITVDPPQYGIQLTGASNLRFTEEHRLCSTEPGHGPPPPTPAPKPPPPKPQRGANQLGAECRCCGTELAPHHVRAIAPDAVSAWEAARTASWLQANDVIACPHPRCGALIQRVPAAPPRAPLSPLRSRNQQQQKKGKAQEQQQQSRPHAQLSAAEAHRERHRYRCGACSRDFCDACRAAPYHTGLTCRQARAPDCLLCGSKVEENRLQGLLPDAFGVSADMQTAYRSKLRSRRGAGGGGDAASGSGGGPAGGGGSGAGSASGGGSGGSDEVDEAAVVARASRTELLVALKSRVGLDTAWCVERPDLEKALLHWGCRTCSGSACATRLRAMCGRPLPCGHWCCGLRGEGPAHPRCVECGADPNAAAAAAAAGTSAAAAAAAGSSGSGSGSGSGAGPQASAGAGPATPVRGGGAAAPMLSECCFCWEPLPTAACIEMACGARHMCHLHCAEARLRAGYPGPNISFAHLYCPLCRGGDGAVGPSPGGSSGSPVQAALAPVHLEHPALAAALAPHLALRQAVVAAARQRLRLDAGMRAEPELQPGGRYEGRLADYALERLMFYKCSKCSKPYYGGQRACGAAAGAEPAAAAAEPQAAAADGAAGQAAGGAPAPAPAAAAADGKELVCGECCALAVGADCPRHGTAYIEWKCKYCCSLASWFCWGTTHFCEPCHAAIAKAPLGPFLDKGPTCRETKCGLRGIKHPPPGQEACLGCGMCRAGL